MSSFEAVQRELPCKNADLSCRINELQNGGEVDELAGEKLAQHETIARVQMGMDDAAKITSLLVPKTEVKEEIVQQISEFDQQLQEERSSHQHGETAMNKTKAAAVKKPAKGKRKKNGGNYGRVRRRPKRTINSIMANSATIPAYIGDSQKRERIGSSPIGKRTSGKDNEASSPLMKRRSQSASKNRDEMPPPAKKCIASTVGTFPLQTTSTAHLSMLTPLPGSSHPSSSVNATTPPTVTTTVRALKENEEQKTLEAKMNEVVQMLSTQKEQHHKEMEQLKDGFSKEMDQLKDGFAKMLAEQQKQMSAQFQSEKNSLEQKLKEAEQRAQMEKNELEEIIKANQQKMDKEEMDKNDQQAFQSSGKGGMAKLTNGPAEIRQNQQKAIGSNVNTRKILANPKGIVWNRSKSEADSISECGLKVTGCELVFAIATEGYAISGKHCRKNYQFSGTIVFYYEITKPIYWYSSVGFTDGSKPSGCVVGGSPNSYGITANTSGKYSYCLSGIEHKLERPTGAIAQGDAIGCGLLLNSKNELAIFFTRNGKLLVKQTPINPTVDRLYPTVLTYRASVEANFGDDLVANPFNFDTDKWPGLVFE